MFQNIHRERMSKTHLLYLNCDIQTLPDHYPMNISMKSRLGLPLT